MAKIIETSVPPNSTSNAVPNTRKVNNKALSADITINAVDIPTDANNRFVSDAEKGKINLGQPVASLRDFTLGTLVQTDIDYSQPNGDPFLLEVSGNSYVQLFPFDMSYQGYSYSSTIISHGGISTRPFSALMTCFNYNGKLCFWWPRLAYWQGFYVFVSVPFPANYKLNRVVSITDSAKPAGITKEVSLNTWDSIITAVPSVAVPVPSSTLATLQTAVLSIIDALKSKGITL